MFDSAINSNWLDSSHDLGGVRIESTEDRQAYRTTGHTFKVKRYVLTASGKRFYSEKEVNQIDLGAAEKVMWSDISYGKKSLDKIVKRDGPMKFGDYQEANVKYLFKIDGLASWTEKSEFRTAFPYIDQIIDTAGKQEQQGAVKLTCLGGSPKG